MAECTSPNIKAKVNIPNKDAYQRINFLFQAAILNLGLGNVDLGQHYMKYFRKVKEKKVLRWSREIKHSICDGCNMLLVPGVTTKTRIRGNNRIIITCLCCKTRKISHTSKPAVSNAKKRRKRRQRRNFQIKKEKNTSNDVMVT